MVSDLECCCLETKSMMLAAMGNIDGLSGYEILMLLRMRRKELLLSFDMARMVQVTGRK